MAQRQQRRARTRGRAARRPWWRAALASPVGLGLVLIAGLVLAIVGVRAVSSSPERQLSQATPGVVGAARDSSLSEGVAAPPVVLPTTSRGTFDLAEYRGKRNVLIYFYEHAG